MADMKFDYNAQEALKEFLQAGPVVVTFTKVDGTERTMRCTTNIDLIPEEKRPKEGIVYSDEIEPTTVRVFELDLQQWRSFRKDSVKSFKLTLVGE